MATPIPFKIAVPQAKLDKLRQQLLLTEFPNDFETTKHGARGVPLSEMKRLVEYWIENFDWAAQEAELNKLPQFTVDIEINGFGTQNVHFVHQKSSREASVPLLFLHGWPGNFAEVTKLLQPLTDAKNDYPSFHIVAPSLINFGFSKGTLKEGFGNDQHAEVYHKLMITLGYSQYVVQGGDIGAIIARFIAGNHPEACRAHHVNMPIPGPPDKERFPSIAAHIDAQGGLSEADQARLALMQDHMANNCGYIGMHDTRPQTLGYSLADSPAGLLAWIYEKLVAWTDEFPWKPDEILTWICIYRFSRAGPDAAQHQYYESSKRPGMSTQNYIQQYFDTALGISLFPREIVQLPLAWNPTLGPIVFQREHQKGGHFAAWENPQALINDLREMFGRQGGAFNCIQGRSGY